jgi:hypothetical protein
MNERIKQLAEQAGLEYNFDPMLWLKHEKFAELIVRECLNTMENCDGDLDFAIWKTKEHFGVEE